MINHADIINAVFGDGNITIQGSDNNNLHLTQHIYYDAKSKTLRVECPNCYTPASPETREQLNENAAFNCQKCGTRFYENDLLEKSTNTYMDLIEAENLKFKRLLNAVNHDLRTDDSQEAFNRCFQNKEVFGRTPQIYEWGALTLFFARPIEETIHNSARKIIGYLEESQRLDPKSQTYEQIAGSIATRYYHGVLSLLDKSKLIKPSFPVLHKEMSYGERKNLKIEYLENLVDCQQKMFRYLRELDTCYRLFPNPVFLETTIQEFYGHRGISWINRYFIGWSILRPQISPPAYKKTIKGYIWDYHVLCINIDYLYRPDELMPIDFLIQVEKTIRTKHPEITFPEIRVGKIGRPAISVNAGLRLYQWGFWLITAATLVFLWKNSRFVLLILVSIGIVFFLHLKDKPEKNKLFA